MIEQTYTSYGEFFYIRTRKELLADQINSFSFLGGVEWLSGTAQAQTGRDIAFYLDIGAVALALTAVLNTFSGFMRVFFT